MITKFKNILAGFAALALLAVPLAVPTAAYAIANEDTVVDSLACGSKFQISETECSVDGADVSGDGLETMLRTAVDIFSVIVGVIAVIMIIFGGLRYITSGGDSGNVSTAKNTIIYAIIGLIIVALAQFIVQFVISNVNVIN